MPTFTEKTEAGNVSKLYGKLPALSYKVAAFEKAGDDRLGEVLDLFGGNAEAVANAALTAYNESQRDNAGGAFTKFLKHARNLIKGGAVAGISIETVKDEKGNEVVSEKTASIIQSLANTMLAASTALSGK